MYLDVAMELGLPVLFLLLYIFFNIFKIALNTFRTTIDPFYKALSLSLIGSLTAVIVGNMFGNRLDFFAASGYFMILVGMVSRIYHVEVMANSQPKK